MRRRGPPDVPGIVPYVKAKFDALRAFNVAYLGDVLEKAGTVTRAAYAAGLDRSNFRRLMKQHGVPYVFPAMADEVHGADVSAASVPPGAPEVKPAEPGDTLDEDAG